MVAGSFHEVQILTTSLAHYFDERLLFEESQIMLRTPHELQSGDVILVLGTRVSISRIIPLPRAVIAIGHDMEDNERRHLVRGLVEVAGHERLERIDQGCSESALEQIGYIDPSQAAELLGY